MSSFYIGSCRYQGFIPNFFPPRLHTTAEILNFLNKYITGTLTFNDNVEFGHAIHPEVIKQSEIFLETKPLNSRCSKMFMEICSNKFGYMGNTIVSDYYSRGCNLDIVYKKQSIDDIRRDIIEIKYLLSTHFNINNVYIITHISIPLKSGDIIHDRENLKNELLTLSDIVNVIDISAFMKTKYSTLEEIFPDSCHWCLSSYRTVEAFLSRHLS